MPKINYLNFDLLVSRTGDDAYLVTLRSPVGEAIEPHVFQKSDLLPTENETAGPALVTSVPKRDFEFDEEDDYLSFLPQPLTLQQAQFVGNKLFSVLFNDDLYLNFRRSMDFVKTKDSRLRIRLNLTQTPELAVLPWEYLYDKRLNHFYVEDVRTPVVRYLNHDEPIEELLINGKLRILVVVSQPSDLDQLAVETEWKNIAAAFNTLEEKNVIEITRLEKATFKALRDKLDLQPEDAPFHVFHFIGHSAFDRKENAGKLFFEDDQGKADSVRSERLAVRLHNNRALRLVVLNACEGASLSAMDSYSGIAQNLLRQADVPAVIAMQYKITDRAALEFSERFYKMLANGHPIDSALSLARSAISGDGNETEWATPVLYMRSDSGELLNPQRPLNEQNIHSTITEKKEDDPDYEKYGKVVAAILEGRLVPFIGLDANLFGRDEIENWQPESGVLPSSRELACYLASIFDYPKEEPHDLTSVSQFISVKEGGTGRLYECLSGIFRQDYEPSPLHKFWAKVPALIQKSLGNAGGDPLRRRFIIATTNYDCMLEKAFEKQVPVFHVVSYVVGREQSGRFHHAKFENSRIVGEFTEIKDPANYPALSNEEPVILKLPGAFEQFEQRFAITEDHYSDYLTNIGLSGLLPPQVKGKLKSSCHLFFGSSLRNWYLRALLYRIWENRKPNSLSWSVHPVPRIIDEQFWKVSDVEVVIEKFDVYVSELERRLKDYLKEGDGE